MLSGKEIQFGSDSVDMIRRLELGITGVKVVVGSSDAVWDSSRFLPTMPDDLREIADLFRATAAQLRRLSKGRIRTKRDTMVAIEAYLYKDQMRSAPAFPPHQCQETANLLEEFVDKLEALIDSSRQHG